MKIGVSTYSFGWLRTEGQLGIIGTIDKASEMGFKGIEFVEGDWVKKDGMPQKIYEECKKMNIKPISFCVGSDLLKGKNEVRRVCKLIDIASELNVKFFRHDVAYSGTNFDIVANGLADSCREITQYAKKYNIKTMIENHGMFIQDSDRIERLVTSVNDENFGALIDVGNFMCVDEETYKAVSRLVPYCFHVHVKDFQHKSGRYINPGRNWMMTRGGDYLRPAIIGNGDANVFQCLRILRDSGYKGYYDIEFEGIEEVITGITIGKENLERYFKVLENEKIGNK